MSWLSWRETRELHLAVRVSNPVDVDAVRGLNFLAPLPVGVVNDSQRSVSLVAGQVQLDGREVGRVTAVIPDPTRIGDVIENRNTDDLDRELGSEELPYEIGPGEGKSIALMWETVSNAADTRFENATVRHVDLDSGQRPSVQGRVCPQGTPSGWSDGLPDDAQGPVLRGRLAVRLSFSPGGTRTLALPLRPAYSSYSVSAYFRYGWRVFVDLAPRSTRPSYIFAEPATSKAGVVQFDIWGARGHVRTLTQPVSGPFPCFSVAHLRDGAYKWLMRMDGRTVAAGELDEPCPRGLIRGFGRVAPVYACGSAN